MPAFRYHPDPVGTGSAIASDEPCEVCKQPAGYKYAGGEIFGLQAEVVCLRCIANGAAAARLALPDGPAEFTDVGWGVPDDVPASVLQEVSQRTPGFIGWQQEHWMYHCSDAAAFLGLVGWDDVAELPDAIESLRADLADIGLGQDEADLQIKMIAPRRRPDRVPLSLPPLRCTPGVLGRQLILAEAARLGQSGPPTARPVGEASASAASRADGHIGWPFRLWLSYAQVEVASMPAFAVAR